MVKVDFNFRHALQRIEKAAKQIEKAERTAVKRSAVCIRSMELAALRHNGSKHTGGKFPKMTDLHDLLNGPKTGGKLVNTKLFHIVWSNDAATIDWNDKIKPYVERWQRGGTYNGLDRPEMRAALYRFVNYRLGKAAAAGLQIVPTIQPPREFVGPIGEVAKREFPRWVERNLEKILAQRAARDSIWNTPFTRVVK